MKILTELIKILGITVIVGLIIIVISTQGEHFSCSALDTFSGESSINEFKTLLIAIVIWITAFTAYLFIRKNKNINQILYFAILTTIALHSPIINKIKRPLEEHRKLKEKICEKASDDGTLVNFEKLTKSEYDFINSKTNWLPSIPEKSKAINIEYIGDDFLGDYHLKIELALMQGAKIDSTKYPKWKLNGNIFFYEESQY